MVEGRAEPVGRRDWVFNECKISLGRDEKGLEIADGNDCIKFKCTYCQETVYLKMVKIWYILCWGYFT